MELVFKLGDVTDAGWLFALLLVGGEGRVRGDGVNDAVAGRACHVMPVSLSVMESSVLPGVCPGRGYWAGGWCTQCAADSLRALA